MLYGRIVRPSALEAKLVSSDTKAAEAMPGVVVVRDGDFIGVAAPDRETAIRAEKAIAVHWQAPGQPGNDELFAYLKKNAAAVARASGRDQSPTAWQPRRRNSRKRTTSPTSLTRHSSHALLSPSGTTAS